MTAPAARPTPLNLVPASLNVAYIRGDTVRFGVAFTDGAGAPLDLSGGTWLGEIRHHPDDLEPIDVWTVTVVDDSHLELVLVPAVTAALPVSAVFDLQRSTGPDDVHTVLRGRLQQAADVTRA